MFEGKVKTCLFVSCGCLLEGRKGGSADTVQQKKKQHKEEILASIIYTQIQIMKNR